MECDDFVPGHDPLAPPDEEEPAAHGVAVQVPPPAAQRTKTSSKDQRSTLIRDQLKHDSTANSTARVASRAARTGRSASSRARSC